MSTWPPCLPKGVSYPEIQHPVLARCQSSRESVYGLLRSYREGELLIPKYQRGSVWTERQQAEFVGFMLEGSPVPALYIRDLDVDGNFADELVDGQQRLNALVAWEDGLIPAVLPSQNKSVWVKDMEWPGWRLNLAFPVGRFRGTTAEAMTLYLAINTRGTPHTEAELRRVREMLEQER